MKWASSSSRSVEQPDAERSGELLPELSLRGPTNLEAIELKNYTTAGPHPGTPAGEIKDRMIGKAVFTCCWITMVTSGASRG